MKYIKVQSTQNELIPIVDIYAFIYESEKGKTVLRITIKDDVKDFNELKNLLSHGYDIFVYEEQENNNNNLEGNISESTIELTAEHKNYSKEYKCNYNANNNEFFIEITKKTDVELMVEQNKADTLIAYNAIAELYEMSL